MGKGIKTGGRDFTPGNKLGKGRPKIPDDIKEARKMDQFELERIMNYQLNITQPELATLLKSGQMTTKEMIMGSIINKAIVHGDQHRLDFILNRLIGKVTEHVKHSGIQFTLHNIESGNQVIMGAQPLEESE